MKKKEIKKQNGDNSAPRVLIGKDTRISSDVLEAALTAGILSIGADAVILGVVPTPAVAYLVKYYDADAGVMISASHNSVEYNGIKLFSDFEIEHNRICHILSSECKILIGNCHKALCYSLFTVTIK
mgnify:CR=1 FL=1